LYVAASSRLPIVLAVACRALTGPININHDYSDSMAERDSGFIQLYGENNQEVYDNYLMAHRIAEHPDVRLPLMVCEDGFITSHALENIELEDDAGGTEAEPTAKGEAPSEPAPARTEYLEVEHHIEEHRYGFQSYPEYKPPRRGAISDLDLLKQFTYAQAPFSVDYFLQGYREYCYAPGQRMNATIQRSGIGYLQTKLRDTVTVRQEHGAEYVFRRLVKAHITECQIPQSNMVEAQTCLVGLQCYPQVIIVNAAF
jgi:hypothetical protein